MKTICVISVFLLLAVIANTASTQSTPPYKNPNLPLEQRVDDLLSRLTLEEKVAQMGNATPAIERLGVPAHDYWNEALHGVARSGVATVFPQAIGLGATWDTALMYQVADVELPGVPAPTTADCDCSETGHEGAAGVTATWSNVAVAAAAAVWLLTARPTKTCVPIGIESVPTSVHVAPSAD